MLTALSDVQNGRSSPRPATFGTDDEIKLRGDDNASLRRLRGVLDNLAAEAHIAFICARDVHYTGGLEQHDGARLRLAYERLRQYARYVDDARREVSR